MTNQQDEGAELREKKRKIIRDAVNEACNILVDYGGLNTDEYKEAEAKAIRRISALLHQQKQRVLDEQMDSIKKYGDVYELLDMAETMVYDDGGEALVVTVEQAQAAITTALKQQLDELEGKAVEFDMNDAMMYEHRHGGKLPNVVHLSAIIEARSKL